MHAYFHYWSCLVLVKHHTLHRTSAQLSAHDELTVLRSSRCCSVDERELKSVAKFVDIGKLVSTSNVSWYPCPPLVSLIHLWFISYIWPLFHCEQLFNNESPFMDSSINVNSLSLLTFLWIQTNSLSLWSIECYNKFTPIINLLMITHELSLLIYIDSCTYYESYYGFLHS